MDRTAKNWLYRPYSIVAVVLALITVGIIAPTQANAYALTGCKWGSSTITYQNNAVSGFNDSLVDAGYSWAAASDINGMNPTGGAMVAYTVNNGANGYDGYTSWNCPGGNLWSANVSMNTYYATSMSYGQKRVVWAHELGHGMGLNHSYAGTVMYSCARCTYDSYGRYSPAADDAAGMNALY